MISLAFSDRRVLTDSLTGGRGVVSPCCCWLEDNPPAVEAPTPTEGTGVEPWTPSPGRLGFECTEEEEFSADGPRPAAAAAFAGAALTVVLRLYLGIVEESLPPLINDATVAMLARFMRATAFSVLAVINSTIWYEQTTK